MSGRKGGLQGGGRVRLGGGLLSAGAVAVVVVVYDFCGGPGRSVAVLPCLRRLQTGLAGTLAGWLVG